eukprot:TRINITY_DN32553_c0_g1_i1.p2 TRINITY_DN32553_c0_g1~~TRINITY_DN32553_c0_g1_i1.p2  ORF type:complete len:272 (+),score=50.63 TRINITY_DN32553_c0_g1_i1:52-867(+)
MASSDGYAVGRVLGMGAKTSSSTDMSACGSGLMLRELGGEHIDSAKIQAAPPGVRVARLAAVRGCAEEHTVDAHGQRSVEPEPQTRPSPTFVPKQQSVKPTPRMRYGGCSNSRIMEAVPREIMAHAGIASTEDIGEEAANVLGRQYEVVAGLFDQGIVSSRNASELVTVATGYPFGSSNGAPEMGHFLALDQLPSKSIAQLPAIGDAQIYSAHQSREGVRDDDNLLRTYASNNRKSGNEQANVMAAEGKHESTFLSLPDTLVVSDTSDEEA